ncbi:hypothetical protein CVT24_011645 [Panaeolus cyanescens]|uniref:Uncharacterized protein n=1 Tax=Panaeolus cyanescens TaxID=181874 RepID=A0A409YH10_9AGAR|nr:hypothetical protein CVT24_011645 [Panaeolus cyanescens]
MSIPSNPLPTHQHSARWSQPDPNQDSSTSEALADLDEQEMYAGGRPMSSFYSSSSSSGSSDVLIGLDAAMTRRRSDPISSSTRSEPAVWSPQEAIDEASRERWNVNEPHLPSNPAHLFILAQRRKRYVDYGIIPVLIFAARLMADFSISMLCITILKKLKGLGPTWIDVAIKTVMAIKTGSWVLPAIKLIRNIPALRSSSFQSLPALILEVLFISTCAVYISFIPNSPSSQHFGEDLHRRIRTFLRKVKHGMGFGVDLELYVPALLELAITHRCDMSDVISCLRDYSKDNPRALIDDVLNMRKVTGQMISSAQYDLREMKTLSAELVNDFFIAHFLQVLADDDSGFAFEALSTFRAELVCRMINHGIDADAESGTRKAVASLFVPRQALRLKFLLEGGNIRTGIEDGCKEQLLKVTAAGLAKGFLIEDLMQFCEELVDSLLQSESVRRVPIEAAIVGFTAAWAMFCCGPNCKANAEQVERFARYRDKIKGKFSGEKIWNGWLSPARMDQALDYTGPLPAVS